jgi:signal transduction histidine kinase
MIALVEELAGDLGFGAEDAARLAELAEPLGPVLPLVVDHFYERIGANERMRAVFDGDAQIERQKGHLLDWLHRMFSGRYDEDYWRVRERIGRTHVRIGLDLHYMVSMMGVIRSSLERRLRDLGDAGWSEERRIAAWSSLAKLLDLELAVMLSTYEAVFVRRARAGERLATLGQVAASIGHELRNPLAVIDSSVELVRRRIGDEPKVTKHLDRVGEQVRVADGIITNLLGMVRDQPPKRRRTDVAATVEQTWAAVRDRGDATLETELAVTEAWVDPTQIRQLVLNLLQNAIDAGAGRVRVSSRLEEDALELLVEDDGHGLPEGAEAWLFEPLATSREQGSGLGLALCHRIVEKHGGSIGAERLERGTRVRARFAAALDEPEER